ncbi:MAG: HlyD family efflux transporter periplasmic adaptor subunit [Planctomycetota bacterium]
MPTERLGCKAATFASSIGCGQSGDGSAHWVCVLFAAVILTGCGREDVSGTSSPPKPVEVQLLEVGVPRAETIIAAVVEPYRQSDTSFDVSGLLTKVIDRGEAVEGPQYDGLGELLIDGQGSYVSEGAVLARLDDTRFRQAVASAELAIASTDRQIDALKVELDQVFPARLENAEASAAAAAAEVASSRESVTAAEAELELARTTVVRDRVLIRSGAIAQSVLDESESSFRTAAADLAAARASLDASLQSERSSKASASETRADFQVRRADLASLVATRSELENDLDQAITDLESCVLRAPFSGRITDRYAERGSYVAAGSPIVELTMEDAVKVVLTVSADQERRLVLGSQLPVYADALDSSGDPERYMATIFEKSGVADSGTRTFRVGLILPNPALDLGLEAEPSARASVDDLFPVMNLPGSVRDGLYVHVRSVLESDGATHVLVLPKPSGTSSGERVMLVPRAVRVELLDDWDQLDTETLRRVSAESRLALGDVLVLDPEPADLQGVRVGTVRYALRPGDVVRVGVNASLPEEGFWLPSTAVVSRTGDTFVFGVREGVAREVPVDLFEVSGSFRRVSSPELEPGLPIVVRGMQYLADGDSVSSRAAASEAAR